MVQIFYCDQFVLPLPPKHRFPMTKYRLLRQRVARAVGSLGAVLEVPPAASDEQILRVHEAGYLRRVCSGELDRQEVRRLGFPWSPELVQRSRRSVGGTLAALRAALSDGCGVNLAGGTHHAFADRGEGFCVLNDAAIAARTLQAEGRIERLLVVDCDVHQGNGTAAIFRHDPTVFTLSLHGRRNYPFHKEVSDLDIELEDGTTDDEYLRLLEEALERAWSACRADAVIYLAGADPYVGDRLGRLGLSKKGLAERDRRVVDSCRQRGVPVAVVMAGGYADNVDDIVDIHFHSVEYACRAATAQPRVMTRPRSARG